MREGCTWSRYSKEGVLEVTVGTVNITNDAGNEGMRHSGIC